MAREVEEIALALIGGICGVVAAERLMEADARGERAAMAVMVGGGLAAIMLPGRARSLAVGATAACAGQLGLMWLQARALAAVQGEPAKANAATHAVPDLKTRGPEPEVAAPAKVSKQPESAVDARSNPADVPGGETGPDRATSGKDANAAPRDSGDDLRNAAPSAAGSGP